MHGYPLTSPMYTKVNNVTFKINNCFLKEIYACVKGMRKDSIFKVILFCSLRIKAIKICGHINYWYCHYFVTIIRSSPLLLNDSQSAMCSTRTSSFTTLPRPVSSKHFMSSGHQWQRDKIITLWSQALVPEVMSPTCSPRKVFVTVGFSKLIL